MRRFPGTIERGGRNHRKVILNAEQEAWLKENYPITENARLAQAMGCNIDTMRDYASKLGVTGKSEKGLQAINKRRGRAAAKTNERNGCFDRKRGARSERGDDRGCTQTVGTNTRRGRKSAIRDVKKERPQEIPSRNAETLSEPQRNDTQGETADGVRTGT